MNVRLPPSYPHGSGAVQMAPQQQSGQYANYQGNWAGQNVSFLICISEPNLYGKMFLLRPICQVS
jgi:hypothetical protein